MFLQVFFFGGGGLKWDSLKKQTNKKRVPVLLFPSIARFQPELTPVFFYLVLLSFAQDVNVFHGFSRCSLKASIFTDLNCWVLGGYIRFYQTVLSFT